jgi:hypothetical protein
MKIHKSSLRRRITDTTPACELRLFSWETNAAILVKECGKKIESLKKAEGSMDVVEMDEMHSYVSGKKAIADMDGC